MKDPRHGPDFGKFRPTAETVWRKPQETFAPRYRLDLATHEHLRWVERCDHSLGLLVNDGLLRRALWDDAIHRRGYGAMALEGDTTIYLKDVKAILDQGRTDDASSQAKEVLNYAELVWNLGYDPPPMPEEPNGVRSFHESLFRDVHPDAGRYKEAPTFTTNAEGEVVHVAAMPEDVAPELGALLNWLHHAPEPPLVRASVFFHEFLSIAPFRHGNARVANALTIHFLQSTGYPNVVFAAVDYEMNWRRQTYDDAFAACAGGDLGTWVRFMAEALHAAFARPADRAWFRRELPRDLDPRIVDVADWIARRHLFLMGMEVKAGEIAEEFPDLPRRTLQRGLTTLCEAGVLRRLGAGAGTAYVLAE